MRRRSRPPSLFVLLAAALVGCGDDPAAPPSSPSWQKHGLVLSHGAAGSWDDLEVAGPFVVRAAPDSYTMWYAGRDSSTTQIGVATSSDGTTWSRFAGNPVLGPGPAGSWDALGVESPCVVREGSGYRMYYTGIGATSRSIGFATSSDGMQWTRFAGNPVLAPSPTGTSWDDRDVYTPWVLHDGAGYTMWYGADGSHSLAIGRAASPDGITWSRLLFPVLEPMVLEALNFAPCVLKSGSSYRMWYGALHENPAGGTFPAAIDYAQSQDGIEWTWNRTVLMPGSSESWDGRDLCSACVVDEGSVLKMWYEGESSGRISAIGIAILE